MVENTWNRCQIWLSNLALKAWPVLQKSSLYARWMLNWPKDMNTAMWHEVLLVYHPQLHGLWLSTEKRTMTKELVAEIFHQNFPVWFWWSSHKNLMENFKVLFEVMCPWGSEVSFVSSLTPSLLGCFRNLWFWSVTPFFTLFGWEVLELNCWRNSGKGEFFDQNFM